MNTTTFNRYPFTNNYYCDHLDDQSGRYVRAEVAEKLLAFTKAMIRWEATAHPNPPDEETAAAYMEIMRIGVEALTELGERLDQ